MGAGDIYGHLMSLKDLFYDYFNPIGRLYLQIQFLCRVVIPTMVLGDMFAGDGLMCDTQQIGCEQNCVNRFTPINHQRVWEMELFMILFSVTIFTVFHMINRLQFKKHGGIPCTGPDTHAQINATFDYRFKTSVRHTKEGKDKQVMVSRITRCGYIVMLCVRLACEFVFLYVENQLGKHQSQNIAFWDAFNLKESWICATNNVDSAAQHSLAQLIPVTNRSEIFWTDELNVACLQQKVTVTCWIPYSRMKSLWLWFMYIVLCISACLTAFELLFELLSQGCKGKKSAPYHEAQTLKSKPEN